MGVKIRKKLRWMFLKIDIILIILFKNKGKELQVEELVWTRAWWGWISLKNNDSVTAD